MSKKTLKCVLLNNTSKYYRFESETRPLHCKEHFQHPKLRINMKTGYGLEAAHGPMLADAVCRGQCFRLKGPVCRRRRGGTDVKDEARL